MPLAPSIFLAAGDGPPVDIVVWLIAGAIWLVSQVVAVKKKQGKKGGASPSSSSPSAAARSGGGEAPTPKELVEIFRRLGADIPSTPPPPSTTAVRPPPAPAPRMAHRPAQKFAPRKSAPAAVHPDIARRLARAKKEVEAAADLADTERIALNAIVPGVQSRAGETRALDTATRHTGAILPRLYAMSMRMPPLPSVPMPGFDRSHHTAVPLRSKLHSRREIRDALIAQTFLQPSKGAIR